MSVEDFRERRQFRGQEEAIPELLINLGATDPTYLRHTVDLERSPRHSRSDDQQQGGNGAAFFWGIAIGSALGILIQTWVVHR